MRILCLCPTYGYPRHLIETAIFCFLNQDYPLELRRLLIMDDLGNVAPLRGKGWMVDSRRVRYPSLPDKYNAMCQSELWGDALVVWEVDDLYLPWHLSSHALALQRNDWSHPRRCWSTYTGQPEIEGASGRFHASLALTRAAHGRIGGWPATRRADFDQQLLGRLRDQCGPQGFPDEGGAQPSYVFRWNDTGALHGQHLMRSPDDESWYDRATPRETSPIVELIPRLDPPAQRTVLELQQRIPGWEWKPSTAG